MAGAFDEAAVAERGGDRGEVAAVDAERVGELGLAGLAEHLQLLEDEELLRAEAERAKGAADAGGRVAAEPGQESRTRSGVGTSRLVGLFTIVVDYHHCRHESGTR